MAKLHELLAVEGPLKQQAEKTRNDLAHTFEKKRHLFSEKLTTFQPLTEGAQVLTEEQSALQSSVRQELRWIAGIWSKALDAAYTVAEANTVARADVTIESGGPTLLKNVPTTALLELEHRAQEIFTLVQAIPTLDPAKAFTLDPSRGATGDRIYQARVDIKQRTKKIQRPIVLYEATKEHPAQVQILSEDVPIGEIRTQEWSGLVTPSEKADMLDRAEKLKRALKVARSKANSVDIQSIQVEGPAVGSTLLSFVFDSPSG